MKEDELLAQKQGKKGWFLSATPWVGCPVTFNLVVVGVDDPVKATDKFKNFFGNKDLEVSMCIPVAVVEEGPLIN